ncbi:MAG TPA: hypothetical protein ENG75_02385, partial [Nitrospirae bacterium]|nr:hypothetical protein [Nitrospirota bacterium]
MELKEYWKIIWRRKWIIVYAVILMVLFTNFILLITPTIYKSNAKVIFNMQEIEPYFIDGVPSDITLMRFVKSENAMGTIEELIESVPVIQGTINKLGLKDSDGKLLTMDDFVDPSFFQILSKGKGVEINNLEASEAFEIIGYSEDPAQAQNIAETVYENLIIEFSSRYRDEILNAKRAVEKRLLDVRVSLSEADIRVSEYKSSNKLYVPTTQINSLLSGIVDLKKEKETALRSLSEAETSLDNIKRASWVDQQKFKDVWVKIESSSMIEYYRKQLLTNETALEMLLLEYTSEHPDVKIARKNIEVVTGLLETETKKRLSTQIMEGPVFYNTIAQDYTEALMKTIKLTARLNVLSAQIGEKEKGLSRIPEKERQLSDLLIKANSLRSVYVSLLEDFENINSAMELDLANTILFQPPQEGTRYFPQLVKDDWFTYSVLAVGVGVVFGLFFAFLFNYLDSTIRTINDVKKKLNQETVAAFPQIKDLPLTISAGTISPFANEIHNLFSRIKLLGTDTKIITLVSPSGGDGKSIAASHIAHVMTQGDKKAVLIDGNLRNPGIHKIFNLPLSTGFSEFLLGEANFESIISNTFSSNLDVITAGSAALADPQSNLQSDISAQLVKSLLEYY